MPRLATLIASSALFLSGCTALQIGKPTKAVETPFTLPELWIQSNEGSEGEIATGWLAQFRDAELSKLVDEAMAHNHNLKASAARLKAAREGTIIGRSNRLPSVNLSGSGSRSGSRSEEARWRLGSLGAEHQLRPFTQRFLGNRSLGDALRDLEEASVNDYVSQVADFRGARLSLAANTARGLVQLDHFCSARGVC